MMAPCYTGEEMAAGRLRYKLVLAFMGVALLSTALLGAVAVYRLNWELYEQFVRRGRALADHLAEEAFFTAYIQGQRDLGSLAESALAEDVKYVEIVKDGRVLGRAGQPPEGSFLEVWQAILDPELGVERRRSGGEELPKPFTADSYVRLGISLDYLDYEMHRELLWIGLGGLAIGLIALGAAWLLSGVITGPLERVTEAMVSFGRGELDVRAPAERRDELGELAQAFNKMASSIVEMKEELERATRAKSEFITIMGHELRTPLNVLLGYLELLLEGVGGELSAEQRSYVESAMRSGEHLQALLANVLNFAKLEMGVERLSLEEIEISKLVGEVRAALGRSAQDKHLKIVLEVPEIKIFADRTKLRQMLLNLLDNAIRHTAEGKVITIGADLGHDALRLWVSDEGPGIPYDARERIFEPFVRLEEGKEGLGLGLAVVRRYAQLHGGRAWVECEEGRGSRFYVELPLKGEG